MFASVRPARLPDIALLRRYAAGDGGFTDCYVTDVPASVSLADYVAAFYTTPLFRMERWVLRLALRTPSTDAQAHELGYAMRDDFSVWRVEARSDTQLLMCPVDPQTRTWFMVEPHGPTTRLFFGSAVVPRAGQTRLGAGFHLLLGVHGLYSKALLASARRKIGA